jgi:hypothetical protein
VIKNIDDTEVAVKLSGASRDYVIMQLFLKCDHILAKGFDDVLFTKDDLKLEETGNQQNQRKKKN